MSSIRPAATAARDSASDDKEVRRRPVPWRRFYQLARPELPRLLLATLALIVAAGMGLVYPQAIKIIMNALADPDRQAAQRLITQSALGLVAVFAVQGLFSALRAYLFNFSGERVVARLRRDLYAALLRQEIGFFDEQRTGELTNRLASDTTVLQMAVTANVSMLLRYSLTVIGGLSVATFFTLLIVPVFYVVLEGIREKVFKIDPVAAKKRLQEKL